MSETWGLGSCFVTANYPDDDFEYTSIMEEGPPPGEGWELVDTDFTMERPFTWRRCVVPLRTTKEE